jgi:signal peptidase II
MAPPQPAPEPSAGGRPAGGASAPAARSHGRNALPYVWLSVLIVLLDQASKAWIVAHVALYRSIVLLPVLDITHVYNRGAAFSFLNGASGWQRWVFAALAVIVSVVLLAALRQVERRAWLTACGFALILGGAVGNLIDRLRAGQVVDFVNVHWQAHYFPTFNLADSAISVGVVLWLLDTWLEARRKPR